MFDIIAQDASVISIHHICDMVQIRNGIIALHMHEDIALNGCECMVSKSILHLVLDWVDSVKWDNV